MLLNNIARENNWERRSRERPSKIWLLDMEEDLREIGVRIGEGKHRTNMNGQQHWGRPWPYMAMISIINDGYNEI